MANVATVVGEEEELVGGVAPPEEGEEPESGEQPWEDFDAETYASSVGWCNPSLGVTL